MASTVNGAMVSSMLMCLPATRAAPVGRCSSPRNSTLRPTSIRAPNSTALAHQRMTAMAITGGSNSRGDRPRPKTAIEP